MSDVRKWIADLSEGHPGAMVVLATIHETSGDAGLVMVEAVPKLRGSEIWELYNRQERMPKRVLTACWVHAESLTREIVRNRRPTLKVNLGTSLEDKVDG